MTDYKTTLDYITSKFGLQKNGEQVIKLDINRGDLALLFGELHFETGAEIGVERGVFSEIICKANPKGWLYCIDPWKAYGEYDDWTDQQVLETNYEETKKRLEAYQCTLIRKSSLGAMRDFAPNSLDFVYIDGNHKYDYVWEDINGWSGIVKHGGIVSGHDYKARHKEHVGVGLAVDKYITMHNLTLFKVMKGGDSSWFFVNNQP